MPESAPAAAAAEDTTHSFDQGVDDIAALLTDPDDPALQEEGEAQVDDEGQGNEPGPDEVDAPVDADAPAEEDDGQGYSKGKFASDDAKVTLKDGTILSVTDLKRGFLSQRDYYRQTEEIRAEREAVRAEKSQHGELAQALAFQRDFLLSVAPKLLPQPPDPALRETDYIGYQIAKEEYEDKVKLLNQIYHQKQSEDGRRGEETQAEKAARKRDEAQKLLQAIPEFKDRAKYQQFLTEAADVMESEYGITPAEIEAIEDHRYYKAMKDLVRLHKALRKAPQVKADVQGKPKLLQGRARMDPKGKTSREAQSRKEQLRKTGDFDAGVAAIEALI